MIKLLYGTTNKAKITSMERMLAGTDISLANDDSLDLTHVKVNESGASPVENAKIKALAFYDAFQMPVFSCDTGLYFKNVEIRYQPGVAVRRVNGKYLNDEEMIAYYANLAKLHGGKLIAYYQNAISLVMSKDKIYCYGGEDLHPEEFIITSKPHKKRTEGFPLDSLSVHIKSQQFYMDLRADTAHSYVLKKDLGEGFRGFFEKTLQSKVYDN